jgi:hypothetical protein
MGFGFLAASPDAWKRVFLVVGRAQKLHGRFMLFVIVGTLPFALLLPLAVTTPTLPDGPLQATAMFSGVLTHHVLFVAAALGLIASFLSSFNSAVLLSVHLGLVVRRLRSEVREELPRFHWLMVSVLLATFSLFAALVPFSNPYLLANILLGGYAIVAGIQVGTRGFTAALPEGSMLWVVVLGSTAWCLYVVARVDAFVLPTTEQLNTVPSGVGLFLATAGACYLLTRGGRPRARPS